MLRGWIGAIYLDQGLDVARDFYGRQLFSSPSEDELFEKWQSKGSPFSPYNCL